VTSAGAASDPVGSRLLDLVGVMDRLRSPGGCPWDAEQTHESLMRYLVEETYEAVDAIEVGSSDGLREELGDLLLQVVFHARIAAENEGWNIDDVATGIADKLVRRHPHVFSDVQVADADEVRANWEVLKAAEKGRSSPAEGVPLGQPALSLAAALVDRSVAAGALSVNESALDTSVTSQGELGDLLFAIVQAARARGLDPESALRARSRRFIEGLDRPSD
jgi:XTP/dITP diphosphohydrolase